MKKEIKPVGAFANFGLSLHGINGGFEISASRDSTKVWIKRIGGEASGEGGEFHAGDLLEVIDKFYSEHF